MISEKRKQEGKRNKYQESIIVKRLQRLLKKKTGVKYTKTDIKKVWKDYINHVVIPDLAEGREVKLNKRVKLEVTGQRVEKGTRSYNLMVRGLYVTKTGYVKKADNMNMRRLGVKYGVRIITDYNRIFYYQAHPKISKAVHKALNETMVNYRIEK